MSNRFEITPFKDQQEKNDYSYLLESVPKPPFAVLIIAPRNSGKSTMILNMINKMYINPETNCSIFDSIIVCTATALQDPLFVHLKDNPDVEKKCYLSDKIEEELIQSVLRRPYDGKHVLIYLDDFAFEKKNYHLNYSRNYSLKEDTIIIVLLFLVNIIIS